MNQEIIDQIRNEILKQYCTASVKKLTDADIKFIAEVIKPHIIHPDGYIAVRNPHSGMVVMTKGYMASLISFIYEMDGIKSGSQFHPDVLKHYKVTSGRAIQQFDRARGIVLKLDQKMYSNFID